MLVEVTAEKLVGGPFCPLPPVQSRIGIIYKNISNCARILNMPESAEIHTNVGKYALICLTS